MVQTPQAPMMQAQIDRYKVRRRSCSCESADAGICRKRWRNTTRNFMRWRCNCSTPSTSLAVWALSTSSWRGSCVWWTPSSSTPASGSGRSPRFRSSDADEDSLPLPAETPEVFKMLPEYLIEDITELLTFVSKCVAPRDCCRTDDVW